jgi:hypothetical protein
MGGKEERFFGEWAKEERKEKGLLKCGIKVSF